MTPAPAPAAGMSLGEQLRRARTRLAGLDTPRLDAEILLAHVLGRQRTFLYAHPEALLTAAQAAAYDRLLDHRLARMPVAYLTGRREFWSLELTVTGDTLVPRPETELLVAAALACQPDRADATVVDLGTGCGAIAIALATELGHCRIVATDNSPDALAVAARNAERHCPGRIDLRLGDWYEPLGAARVDTVVCNPPYVEAGSPALLGTELAHEPRAALAAGPDGLRDLRRLIHGAGNYLVPGGRLLLEHGAGQARAVSYALQTCGFAGIETRADTAGQPRITMAQWPPPRA